MFDLAPLLRYNETRFLRAPMIFKQMKEKESLMEQKPNVLPLRLEDVSYQYEPDARPAVSHVTLEVERGSFVAVLGHNGSGKSTLAKLMNALFLPTEGRVLVCGMDTLTEEKVWNIRRHAGMVFQNPDNQIVANVVEEDVAFGPKNLGLSEQEVDERVRYALQEVGLVYDEIAERSPFELSGGQMRRVAIAGVLAMRPGTLILDEPTAGLDPAGRRSILGMIRELHAAGGLTVVMVSHNMDDISSLATRLVVMSRGRMVLTGEPRQVFQHRELLSSIGLGIPQAAELTQQLIAEGYPLPADLYTPEEVAEALLKLPRKEEKAC